MSELAAREISDLLQEAFEEGMTYDTYRELLKNLSKDKETTGAVQNEELVHYTRLNNSRMRRWDKVGKVSDKAAQQLRSNVHKANWIILTESWCGDAAHIMPIIQKIALLLPNVELRVALRDTYEALMDQFLTNGGRSIPKLIAFDPQTYEVLYDWGPRPQKAVGIVTKYRSPEGEMDVAYREALQDFYNDDKGKAIVQEFLDLLPKNS